MEDRRAQLQQPLPLTDDDIADLVAFLESLTDPAAADLTAFLPEQVPSGLALDPLPANGDSRAARPSPLRTQNSSRHPRP